MPEEIIITIDAEGGVKVAVKGHAGSGCHALTAPIEAALGETVEDTKTAEYHERPRLGHSAREVAANRH